MRTVGWNILLLTFASLASGQVPKDCSAPDEYPNIKLHPKYVSRQKFSHGEKVYYSCDDDFIAVEGTLAVKCAHGQWTRLSLKCEKRSCGNAGELPNGEFHYEGSTYIGEKVHAVCNEGYVLKGLNYMVCKRSGWPDEYPSCEEGEVTCTTPAVVNSVQRGGDVSVYRVGDNLTLTCSEGFQLDGAQVITCDSSGQWQPQPPRCVPSPEDKITPAPEGEVTCTTPAVVNSVQRGGDVSVYRVGDNLTLTCSDGFQLDGAQVITCDPSGQWQPQPPRCVPSPEDKITPAPGSCGVPQTINNVNAHLADKFATKTSFSSGKKVYYKCDVGYAPAGGTKSRICKNGKWTPLLLKCQRKLCGSAGEILNGQIIYSGVEFGDTATAICDDGFIRVGRANRHCMASGWSGRNPVCEAVVCEQPPEVRNAVRLGLQGESYTYNSAVRYECRVGTLVGEKEIWCTKKGTWSAPAPECKELTCPSPNVPNAYWIGSHNRVFQYRAAISIECDVGYVMTGPRTVYCERDGRWLPMLPRCHRRNRLVNQWR